MNRCQKSPAEPKPPRVHIPRAQVIYTDGESYWRDKRRRQELERAEFMAMVQAGRVVIVRV